MARRPNSPNRTPAQRSIFARLVEAWADYRRSTRPLWRFIPDTERRYLRSLDVDAYTRERRQITQRTASTWAAWVAAVKRIVGRDAIVEVVAYGPTRLPECALVRGPNGSLTMDDYIMGRPRERDQAALERLATIARGHVQGVTQGHKSRTDVWYEKMVKALTEAREKQALKAYALQQRGKHARDHNAWDYWAKRSYLAHGRADRCMRRAVAYKNKLAAAGLVYDMTQINTPVRPPEELNGEATQRIEPRRDAAGSRIAAHH